MRKLVVILSHLLWLMSVGGFNTSNITTPQGNTTDSKDMYVINAMVYQVGIVTNKTDNETHYMDNIGNQEALTFYRHNGSQVDLSQIGAPLVTNVTAHSLVGIAPVSSSQGNSLKQLPWNTFNHFTNIKPSHNSKAVLKQLPPSITVNGDALSRNDDKRVKRTTNNLNKSLFKRGTLERNTPVNVHEGAAVISQTAGVQSIAIPPLLTLNNNLSQIPVPIPNTSVVHYAKINTLLTSP